MAKMTLLEIVQDILNDMSSDKVNSIDDTEESEQVAQIVATTYRLMVSARNWPQNRKLINLIASGTTDRPTHMSFDESVKKIDFINYNKRDASDTKDKYKKIEWRDPEDFLRFINNRDSSDTDVEDVTDPSGVILHIKNDKAPEYYTTFDEETLVFDSYDSGVDSTLQSSKTQVMAYVTSVFEMSDTFVPDIPEEAFGELLETSKTRAQAKLRQFEDTLSAREAQKQSNWNSRNSWTVKGGVKYPNYGRRTGKLYNSTFKQDR